MNKRWITNCKAGAVSSMVPRNSFPEYVWRSYDLLRMGLYESAYFTTTWNEHSESYFRFYYRKSY